MRFGLPATSGPWSFQRAQPAGFWRSRSTCQLLWAAWPFSPRRLPGRTRPPNPAADDRCGQRPRGLLRRASPGHLPVHRSHGPHSSRLPAIGDPFASSAACRGRAEKSDSRHRVRASQGELPSHTSRWGLALNRPNILGHPPVIRRLGRPTLNIHRPFVWYKLS